MHNRLKADNDEDDDDDDDNDDNDDDDDDDDDEDQCGNKCGSRLMGSWDWAESKHEAMSTTDGILPLVMMMMIIMIMKKMMMMFVCFSSSLILAERRVWGSCGILRGLKGWFGELLNGFSRWINSAQNSPSSNDDDGNDSNYGKKDCDDDHHQYCDNLHFHSCYFMVILSV